MCEDCGWEEWVSRIDEVLEVLPDLPDKAFEFASSVHDKLEDMRQWILDNEHVTDAQMTTIENMDAGVRKWL